MFEKGIAEMQQRSHTLHVSGEKRTENYVGDAIHLSHHCVLATVGVCGGGGWGKLSSLGSSLLVLLRGLVIGPRPCDVAGRGGRSLYKALHRAQSV